LSYLQWVNPSEQSVNFSSRKNKYRALIPQEWGFRTRKEYWYLLMEEVLGNWWIQRQCSSGSNIIITGIWKWL